MVYKKLQISLFRVFCRRSKQNIDSATSRTSIYRNHNLRFTFTDCEVSLTKAYKNSLLLRMETFPSDGSRTPGKPPPASWRAIQNLTLVQVTSDDLLEEMNKECLICLVEQKIGATACKLECGHLYHKECVIKWLNKHCTCPVCRYELPTDDADYESERRRRMFKRNMRFRIDELRAKKVSQLRQVASSLLVSLTGCIDKGEVIERLLTSGRIEIIEGAPAIIKSYFDFNAMSVMELRRLLLSFGLSDDGALEKSDLRLRLIKSKRIIIEDSGEQEMDIDDDYSFGGNDVSHKKKWNTSERMFFTDDYSVGDRMFSAEDCCVDDPSGGSADYGGSSNSDNSGRPIPRSNSSSSSNNGGQRQYESNTAESYTAHVDNNIDRDKYSYSSSSGSNRHSNNYIDSNSSNDRSNSNYNNSSGNHTTNGNVREDKSNMEYKYSEGLEEGIRVESGEERRGSEGDTSYSYKSTPVSTIRTDITGFLHSRSNNGNSGNSGKTSESYNSSSGNNNNSNSNSNSSRRSDSTTFTCPRNNTNNNNNNTNNNNNNNSNTNNKSNTSQYKPPPRREEDVREMSVSELRALSTLLSVSIVNCLYKGDIVDRLLASGKVTHSTRGESKG